MVAAVLDLHRGRPLTRAALYDHGVKDEQQENLRDCVAAADSKVPWRVLRGRCRERAAGCGARSHCLGSGCAEASHP